MIHHIFLKLMQLLLTIIIISASAVDKKTTPTHLMGPFQLVFKQVYNCNRTQKNKIQHDMYLGYRGNKSFLFGNSTLEVPFDDSFFKMALKDESGNWKENTFTHRAPKACSSFKKVMGKNWSTFVNGIGFKNTDCPLPPGTYIAPGFDLSILMDTNFPKIFFYGTYKLHMYYSRRNEIFGCFLSII